MSLSKKISKAGLRLATGAVFGILAVAPLESAMARPDIRALRVKPVAFTTLPGWKRDDHALAFTAFLRSCEKMGHGSDTLAKACKRAKKLPRKLSNAQARAFFEGFFAPHKVGSTRKGLLTGYYEPELEGSRVRTRKFNVPLYRRPKDLIGLYSKGARRAARQAGLPNKMTYAKKTRKGLKPYLTREQIESGGLDGRKLEMIWLADPVDAFFLHIQGSGRILLPDGKRIRIGFDGKNGYGYTSVGKVLVRSGGIAKGKVTLDNVKAWLRKNPRLGRKAMWRNKSFIFFRELSSLAKTNGPIGAQGISLIGGRSLAVDRRHYRLGLPIFLSVPNFRKDGKSNLRRLMIAQDTGTAIKGARRGDIFWGSGDKAGDIAGRTYHKGEFFVLLPRRKPMVMKASFERSVTPPAPKPVRRVRPKPVLHSALDTTKRKVTKPKKPARVQKSASLLVRQVTLPPVEQQAAVEQLAEKLAPASVTRRSEPKFVVTGVHAFSRYKSKNF
jgi:peptidoglycan lytic transglycosylase A